MSHGTAGIYPNGATVRAFPFAFDSDGILTGFDVFTPTPGDILLNAWIEVDTAWNGTTPLGNVYITGADNGWWTAIVGPIDMTNADGDSANVGMSYNVGATSGLNEDLATGQVFASGPSSSRFVPAKFTTTDPVLVVVNQNGTLSGADPVATQGSAILYVVTVTPNTGAPSGGWNFVYTQDATYSANVNDFVLVNTTGGGGTVNLPAAQYGDQIGVMSFGNKPCAVVDTVHSVPWFLPESSSFPAGVTFIQVSNGDPGAEEPGGFWVPILPTFTGDVTTVDGNGGFVGDLTVTGLQTNPVTSDAPATNDVLAWNGSAWAPAAPSSGGASINVNSGPVVDSGLAPLTITSQPISQPSGIPQPLPPMSGFEFPGTVEVYTVPESSSTAGIAVGRDGNLWIGDTGIVHQVDRHGVTLNTYTTPQFTSYGGGLNYCDICTGPDENLWVAGGDSDTSHGSVWRLTTGGSFTQHVFATGSNPFFFNAICSGPDGNIWAAGWDQTTNQSQVWKIDPLTGGGTMVYSFALTVGMSSIGVGVDGNIYVGAHDTGYTVGGGAIYRITTGGSATQITAVVQSPGGFCAGPDGNTWMFDSSGAAIWKITPDGTATQIATGIGGAGFDLCAGAGGDLWVASANLWKVTVEGDVTEFVIGGYAKWLCYGPDGGLWLTDGFNDVYDAIFLVQMSGLNITTDNLTVRGQPASTGPNSIVSGSDGAALGDSGLAYSPDQTVIASTNAAGLGVGTSQHSVIVAQAQTVNTGGAYLNTCLGPVILTLQDEHGAGTFLRTMRFRATIVARRIDTPGTDSVWECDGVLRGDGSSAYTWVGGEAPVVTVVAQDAAAADWTVVFSIANFSTSFVQGFVSADDGTTVDWECTLTLDEVAG